MLDGSFHGKRTLGSNPEKGLKRMSLRFSIGTWTRE